MHRSLLISTFLALVACSRGNASADYHPTGPLLRVLVDSAGGVQLNGHATTVAALAESLRAAKPLGGAMIYSRANPDAAPTAAQDPVTKQVLDAAVAARLPIRLVRPESLTTSR